MKLTEIEKDNKLIIKFKYKDKPYSMIVSLIERTSQYILIPSILQNNQVVDPSAFSELEIIYTIKDGIFCYTDVKLDVNQYKGIRVYYVYSEENIAKVNRRDAYRVFIGELVDITVILQNGKKKKIEGILKNLSVTGMGIISKQDIELGATMQILYDFEGINFLMQGQVVRKESIGRYRAFNYGCKFENNNNSVNRIIILKQLRSKKSEEAEKGVN